MIEQLITEGELVEKKWKEALEQLSKSDSQFTSYRVKVLSTTIDSEEFRVWFTKVSNCLQQNHGNLSSVKDFLEQKRLRFLQDGNSLEFYKEAMTILNSVK